MDKGRAMIGRERGPVLSVPPPKTKELKYRVHTWMVKKTLLETNPEWLSSGRVAFSGVAWGEVEPESKKKRKGGDKRKGQWEVGEDGAASSRKAARLELEAPPGHEVMAMEDLDSLFAVNSSTDTGGSPSEG